MLFFGDSSSSRDRLYNSMQMSSSRKDYTVFTWETSWKGWLLESIDVLKNKGGMALVLHFNSLWNSVMSSSSDCYPTSWCFNQNLLNCLNQPPLKIPYSVWFRNYDKKSRIICNRSSASIIQFLNGDKIWFLFHSVSLRYSCILTA